MSKTYKNIIKNKFEKKKLKQLKKKQYKLEDYQNEESESEIEDEILRQLQQKDRTRNAI